MATWENMCEFRVLGHERWRGLEEQRDHAAYDAAFRTRGETVVDVGWREFEDVAADGEDACSAEFRGGVFV